MADEPSHTRTIGENQSQQEPQSRLFLEFFLHFEDYASPFTCILNGGDTTSKNGEDESIPPAPHPYICLPLRRSRRHHGMMDHGMMESSRQVSEVHDEIISTAEDKSKFRVLSFAPYHNHPHGQIAVSKTAMTTKRRVSLLKFDLTSSQQTITSYLENIRDVSHWFFFDLRFEDDCSFAHLSFLLVISHFLCHLELLSSFWFLVTLFIAETNSNGNEDPFSLPMEWHLSLRVISGIIPAIVLISGCTLFVALVCLWSAAEALLLMSLVALYLVECLVPLTLLASMVLYIWGSLSGPNAVATSLSVWFVSLTMARVLRRVIYPRLGMD